MTPGTVLLLDHWAAAPGFRELAVVDAASKLGELLPFYPNPGDQPVAICDQGIRWFPTEMEAVADAIYRASRRPHSRDRTLSGADWNSYRNVAGLWALPGRCKPLKDPRPALCGPVINRARLGGK